jgi:Transmembrane secretion effector
MLWSDDSRAVAVLLIVALGMTQMLQLWHLVLLALFFGTVRGFFSPAYQSIIPQLTDMRDLPSANSLTELSYQLYGSWGPMLSASCVPLQATQQRLPSMDSLSSFRRCAAPPGNALPSNHSFSGSPRAKDTHSSHGGV